MTKVNARQRVLEYLQGHPAVTAGEVARALRVTPANIRHHLSILVSDGRARMLGVRPAQGRGRPLLVYGPGAATAGDNLAVLVDVVLSQWLDALAPAEQDSLLRALAAQLVGLAPGELPGALTRRLAQAIERLNTWRYRARWEAHAQGPRIIFEHCPYAAIIAGHPELCRLDGFILGELLGAQVTQLAKLEPDVRGLPFCMFVVET